MKGIGQNFHMKSLLLLTIISLPLWGQESTAESKAVDPLQSYHNFVNSPKLTLSRSDIIVAEQLVNLRKLVEKGYVNQDVLKKTLTEVDKSKHFKIFQPWLKSIQEISALKSSTELINHCAEYVTRKEVQTVEKSLERMVGNYCRERALETIARDIAKKPELTEEMNKFLQDHIRHFLVKKNKKNFAFFIQSLATKPELLKQVSQLVTTYSVSHQLVPGQEVLKDIMINEQITKLIQDKGFNPLQHKNVFYAEYSTLIQAGYRTLDKDLKPTEKKVKEHYMFLKNYLELNQNHLPMGLCLTRLNDFAKSVFRAGHEDLSRDIYLYIIGKQHKEVLEDAYFFYLWSYLFHNNFKDALKAAERFGLDKDPAAASDPRVKFWLGYSLEKTDKAKEAIRWYEDVVDNNPLSYYSIMSVKKLQLLHPESRAVNFYAVNAVKLLTPISISLQEMTEDHISSLIRLRAWSKIDNQKMIKLELNRLNHHAVPALLNNVAAEKQHHLRSDMHLVTAKLIQESQNHLATFKYLYKVMDKKEVVFNRALLEILYPKPFLDELRKVLKNDSLDPLVVLSLIRQESVFNPLARSPVGARGLMQLMPATARRMRKSVQDTHLVNPQINIELGTQYFKNLFKRYDGNLVYVLSAYKAGESRVERWKNLYWDGDDTILKNIEAIPFLETRNYVKLIFRNIFFYKLLLDTTDAADAGEFNKIYDVSLGFKH
jgi:soluble lytic murein transglycosylase